MAVRLSRRKIAGFVASRLVENDKDALVKLAAYLLETRRTNEVDLLVRDIEDALGQLGVVVADVTTTHKMTSELGQQIDELIKSATNAKTVHVRANLDKSVGGGVRIELPGAEYDATVRRQLTKLQAMKV